MNNSTMCIIMALMGVISMSVVISLVDAQVLPSCGNQVLPCIAYVNSSNPPDICCDPIKDLYETHETCFCQIVSTPGLFETFGFKIGQVFRVIHLCGVKFDTTCKASSPTLPMLSAQPPATRGDEGGGDKIALTRVGYILFIWAFVFFG
ncbi:unnamed protein product [Lathyrus oleraceus]|nr:non-specific lipid transfer protein GPI-anchored 7-like [Pisum sativum]